LFPIKSGLKQYVLLHLLVNFALGSAFRRDQVKQDALKSNGTHQLLVYADDNIMGRSLHTIKKNATFSSC
jgi:hypothetical protein